MATPSRAVRIVLAAALALVGISRAEAQSERETVRWSDVLEQEPGWYASAEAVRVADNVLLFQHPNGGWGKNVDMARVLDDQAKARVRLESRTVETLIDNGATHTQLRFLARVHHATGIGRFREAFVRGMDYLLEAEYERGGWPMIYPLRPGYYEHITFNDGAMIGVMRLLRDAARGEPPFAFVDDARRERARAAVDRGVRVILDAQIVVDGRRTAWCAQHDRIDLRPRAARAYELPSLSGMESVGIVQFLMEIEDPSAEVVQAVQSAVEWLASVKLTGIRVETRSDPSLPRGRDRVVVSDPSAPPMWARFYEIGTNRPMFVGRDGVVRSRLADIEHERRIGYSYLGRWAEQLLDEAYPAWRRRWVSGRRGALDAAPALDTARAAAYH